MSRQDKLQLTNGAGFRNSVLTPEQAADLKRKLGMHTKPPKADLEIMDRIHKAAENKEEGE